MENSSWEWIYVFWKHTDHEYIQRTLNKQTKKKHRRNEKEKNHNVKWNRDEGERERESRSKKKWEAID